MPREKYSCGYANDLYKPFKLKERKFDLCLQQGVYYVIRFDGKGMTAAFKIKHTPINEVFFNTMEETFKNFCKSTTNVLFACSFSDEISILIERSKKKIRKQPLGKITFFVVGEISSTFLS